jgi:hypothetical protein
MSRSLTEKLGVVAGADFRRFACVFEGVLEKRVFVRGAFCGDLMDRCVANVDIKTVVAWMQKTGQRF